MEIKRIGFEIRKKDGSLVENRVLDTEEVITIGTGRSNRLRLSFHGMSSLHATIEVSQKNAVLTDLGNAPPTLINGQPVTKCVLHDGDTICFSPKAGAVTVHFNPDPAEAADSAAQPEANSAASETDAKSESDEGERATPTEPEDLAAENAKLKEELLAALRERDALKKKIDVMARAGGEAVVDFVLALLGIDAKQMLASLKGIIEKGKEK